MIQLFTFIRGHLDPLCAIDTLVYAKLVAWSLWTLSPDGAIHHAVWAFFLKWCRAYDRHGDGDQGKHHQTEKGEVHFGLFDYLQQGEHQKNNISQVDKNWINIKSVKWTYKVAARKLITNLFIYKYVLDILYRLDKTSCSANFGLNLLNTLQSHILWKWL